MKKSNNRYHSYRNYADEKTSLKTPKKSRKRSSLIKLLIVVLIVAGAFLAFEHNRTDATTSKIVSSVKSVTTSKKVATATKPKPSPSICLTNNTAQAIIVSISSRHLWACDYAAQVYDTAVITGDTNVPADVTPAGTYYIYEKETDQHLIGSDSRGSWDDYVNYWMPFYDSPAYGIFGLHDATWRTASDFGNIAPSSDNASHGCVELPLAAATWLYNWSVIGTTVKIVA